MLDLRWWLVASVGACTSRGPEVLVDATPVVATAPPASPRLQMIAGLQQSCALQDGKIYCWGYNGHGELGDGTRNDRRAPAAVVGVGDAVAVVLGAWHGCALRAGGTVVCWGDGARGQIGDGETGTRLQPVAVPGLTGVTALSAGATQTCALGQGGKVRCWGDRHGDKDDEHGSLRPREIAGITGASAIGAGPGFGCAVGQPGAPVGEPRDEHGMGEPPPPASERSRTAPTAVAGIGGTMQLVARGHYTCALQDTGVLRCWHGEGAAALAEPIRLPADTVEVGLGAVHSCARRSGGQVLCWGLNFYGRIGDGTRIDRPQPTAVKGLHDATGISVGLLSSCARRRDGSVGCWGSNFGGQLGDGTEEERATIVPVLGLRDVDMIVSGEDHSCARRSSGEVLCWGSNSEGALGDGSTSTRLVPVPATGLGPVPVTGLGPVRSGGLGPVVALAAGEQQSCALTVTGAVHCWGRDLRALAAPRRWDIARAPAVVTGLPTR